MNQTENKPKSYTGIVLTLTVLINGLIAVLFFMPKSGQVSIANIHILPMLNAIFNSFTFIFLLAALFMIKQKNIQAHKRFILAAFTTTLLFLICYVVYHSVAENTLFGGHGIHSGDLFLYFNYAHLSFRRYRAACAVYADQRIQHASGAPQKNREMDDAALAVCQSDGCHCILNDLTVLLKKAVLCAAFFY